MAKPRAEGNDEFQSSGDAEDDTGAVAVEGPAVGGFFTCGVAGIAKGLLGDVHSQELGCVGRFDVVGADAEFEGVEIDGINERATAGIGAIGR